MVLKFRSLFFSALLLVFSIPAISSGPGSALSLEKIMAGDEWIGYQPGNPWWSADGEKIYFMWNPEGNFSDSLYSYNIKTEKILKVSPQRRREMPPRNVRYDEGKTRMVYTKNGDIFLQDLTTFEIRQLTNTLQSASSPSFTKDGDGLTWIAGNNLYLHDLKGGTTEQLTDFRAGSESQPASLSEQDQWLADQQTDLFTVLAERKEKEEAAKAEGEKDQPERPLTIYTGSASVSDIQLSPCRNYISYLLYANPGATQTKYADYVTLSGYTEESGARPKVGSPQMSVSAGIYNIGCREYYEIETCGLPGIRDIPEYRREYGFDLEEYEEPRDVSVSAIFWAPEGEYAALNIRARDNKDRWIMLLEAESGELSPVDRQRDEAWVAGPGINIWSSASTSMGWMPDSRRVWFQSEASGYSHLYTFDITTGEKRALTSGRFEIYDPQISSDKKYWYYSSNEVHPGERHFYRMPLDGGQSVRITSMEGRSDVALSPDGGRLAIRHSYFNRPWELYIMENRPGAEASQITCSLSDEFKEYDWRVPELLTFTAEDGEEVWTRVFRPDNPEPGGPAVIFVHGAGYLQNAHKWWSSYLREYMFHNLLADMGYTVLDTDFRASAGYGRDWRTGIYRHMGGKDLSDNVDGARFLVEEYGVDPDRIGIYGGSYGGFITLMAMFNHPDIFAAGAALRSVTDWAHYNHGYTSNILNTPVCDSIAFVRSSPIYFAEGLEGALLMCHGMVDDNVQFQDIVRLTQKLIELGKENWELAVYPVESHGFTETSSWVDEYRRILKLFEDTLR